jgi:CelD/BcsL family acetyltransferase involved in cellulose biosynthesis
MTKLQTLKVETVAPAALSAADLDAWRAIQAQVPTFANPLYGPEFALLIGQVRTDAKVAVFRRGEEAVGFLAYHARPGGFARPIGAPFSDYQAFVSKEDLGVSGSEALALAGLNAVRFAGLVDPHALFGAAEGEHSAYAIELNETPDAYLEAVRAASPKKFKNYRRLENRMAETGELRFVSGDKSWDAFDKMLEWKSEQFRTSGLQDVLRPDWVQSMMRRLFESPQGLMLSLYAGDVLVAVHFGIRNGSTYHPWIASTNPEFNAFSPGQAFLGHAVRAMPGLGLKVYDLGPGHDHYKRPFANVQRDLSNKLVVASTAGGRRAAGRDSLWSVGGLGRVGAVDKIRRRLDHIATVDPTVSGRVSGFAQALTGMSRRGLGGDAGAAHGNETASSAVA